jgi:hypothetical protein
MNPQNPEYPPQEDPEKLDPASGDHWGRGYNEDAEGAEHLRPQLENRREEDLFGHLEIEHDHEWNQARRTEQSSVLEVQNQPDSWPYDTTPPDQQPHSDYASDNGYAYENEATDQSWQADIPYEEPVPPAPEPAQPDYLDYRYSGDDDLRYDPPPSLEAGTYAPQTDEPFSYVAPAKPVKDRAPITLLLSAIFLVLLLIAVVVFYKSDINDSALKEIGTPLSDYSDEVIEEAKPLGDNDMKDVVGVQIRPSIGADVTMYKSTSSANSASSLSKSAPQAQTATQEETSNSNSQASQKSSASSSSSASSEVLPVVAKPTSSGTATVQIGAFNSRDVANAQFDKVASKFGRQLTGTVRRIDAVLVGGTTYYRASFTAFATKDQARNFCSSLKSSGQDCIIK